MANLTAAVEVESHAIPLPDSSAITFSAGDRWTSDKCGRVPVNAAEAARLAFEELVGGWATIGTAAPVVVRHPT